MHTGTPPRRDARRRVLAVVSAVITLGALLTVGSSPAAAADESYEYTFRFLNGITLTGSSPDKTAFIADAGGTSVTNPTGMEVHLSCSDEFPGGWGEKDGPEEGVDTAWQLESYFIQKIKDGEVDKQCGSPTPPPPPPEPDVDIEMYVNGDDADDPTGPTVTDPTVKYTYVVTNTGDVPLSIAVTDRDLGSVPCGDPDDLLAPGDSRECDSNMPPALPGQQDGKATVIGTALIPGGPIENLPIPAGAGDGKAYYFKFVNGTVIQGFSEDNEAFLPDAGGTSVENPTGMIVHVSCSDEFSGGWGEKDGPEEGVDTAWQIETFFIQKVKDGGEVEKQCGTVPLGEDVEVEVMDMDPIHYIGVPGDPSIDIEKFVNGQDADDAPGVVLPEGATARFTFIVTNDGPVHVYRIRVVDDVFGAITCPRGNLAPGQSMRCETIEWEVEAGQHTNEACVVGFNRGRRVEDCDPGNVFGTPDPSIDIEKFVNGDDADTAPGLILPRGSTAEFTFIVTNTGETHIYRIRVADDVFGPITCPRGNLAPGQSMRCDPVRIEVTGDAHTNTACVEGFFRGVKTEDCDPANYTPEDPS